MIDEKKARQLIAKHRFTEGDDVYTFKIQNRLGMLSIKQMILTTDYAKEELESVFL